MSRGSGAVTSKALRCLAVWLGVTTAVGGGVLVVRDELAAALRGEWGAPGFEGMLVQGMAVLAAVAGGWLWLITTATVVEAASGLERPAVAGGTIRRIVLVACGAALVGGAVAGPAAATQGRAGRTDTPVSAQGRLLGGLPLPDRASIPRTPARAGTSDAGSGPAQPVAPPVSPAAPAAAPGDTVVVRAGESLWSIAATTLPAGADADEVDRRWREIYAANRAAVGADPDLIRPGLHLRLPPG